MSNPPTEIIASETSGARNPGSALVKTLSVEDVSFQYSPEVKVLDRLSLKVNRGEVVAIAGPSGCGKSTLLSILAGLRRPVSGSVSWYAPDPRLNFGRELALLFQRDTVLPWRTVEENVAFGPQNLKMGKEELRSWVDELLELGGLTQFRKSYPRALSGGMRRRLALLMAIAVRPRVLMLDEPFSSVDEPTRVGLHADVLKMVYEFGISVVLVTQDLAEAVSMADHLYVLTGRPSHVGKEIEIPFGHDRDVFTIRTTPDYNRIYGEAWRTIWSSTTRQGVAAPVLEAQQ